MKLRVFVFDAEETVRHLLSQVLERRGYEVHCFSQAYNCDVCEGRACADVAIADVRLEQGSGIEFVEKQQAIGCLNKHLALMASSWTEEERVRSAKLGCRIFSKPFSQQELNSWLDEVERDIAAARELGDAYLKNTPHARD